MSEVTRCVGDNVRSAMRELSGIDVSFLNIKTDSVFGHVSSLNTYDPTVAPGVA